MIETSSDGFSSKAFGNFGNLLKVFGNLREIV